MNGKLIHIEFKLWSRDFFSVFFALLFPSLALLIFGTLFGDAPSGIPGINQIDLTVPAYTSIVFGVTGLLDLPLTISGSMERGIYKRLDATPAGKEALIGSQLIVNTVMSALGVAILLAVAYLFFGFQIHGNAWSILGVLTLSCASTFAMGFVLAMASPNARTAQALCYIVYFAGMFLSGATLPSFLFPPAVETVSLCLPMTYAVRLTQAAFTGTDGSDAQTACLVLVIVTAGCVLLGYWLARRKDWAK